MECKQLKIVDFQKDSQLQIIDCHSFQRTSIEKISIPSKVTELKMAAFHDCMNLRSIDIPFDSELRRINLGAIDNTLIASIYIPSKIEYFEKSIFKDCEKLQIIEFASKNIIEKIRKCVFPENESLIIMIQN